MEESKGVDLTDLNTDIEHETADQKVEESDHSEGFNHSEEVDHSEKSKVKQDDQTDQSSDDTNCDSNASKADDLDGDLLNSVESDDEVEEDESDDQCEEPRLCHEGCRYEGLETKSKLIKCRLCMVWHHIECVDIVQKNLKKVGFWSCPCCRKMSENIKNLQSSIKSLFSMVEKLSVAVGPLLHEKQENPEDNLLMQSLENKRIECDKLWEQNTTLLKKLKEKQEPDADESVEIVNSSDSEVDSDSESDLEDSCEEVYGHLVIGDSLLKNVSPIVDDITVASKRGAKIHDITKKLKSYKKKFRQITIVCGTNDVSSKVNVSAIGDKFRTLLQLATKKSMSVTVSSIPPRLDEAVREEKLKEANKCLATIADELKVNYVNNDLNFRFKSDIPDLSLLQIDGLHLTSAGVARLLQNLSLEGGVKCSLQDENHSTPTLSNEKPRNSEEKPKKRKVHTRSQNGVTVFLGKESVLSNLYMEAPIHIDGKTYNCNEQFYTHSMATFFKDTDAAAKSLRITNPYQLIDLQKEIVNVDRRRWEHEAKRILYLANMAKYTQNISAREALLNTADDVIGEASFSRTWGIGMSIGDVRALNTDRWKGRNVMGNILMNIRESLSPKVDNRSHAPRNSSYGALKKHCWFCGEENHISKNCRHGQKLQCSSCMHLGHKAKFCELY